MADERADDQRLMERVAQRDRQAFELIYRRYHRQVTRFILLKTGRPAAVDEIYNDTMMVIWRRPEAFDGSSRLSTWIFGIAWRQAMQALRRFDQPLPDAVAADEEADSASADSGLAQRQARSGLETAMATLPEEQRAVVEMTYFQELGYREIAERLQCPLDTIKTRMFHARRKLALQMQGTAADWI